MVDATLGALGDTAFGTGPAALAGRRPGPRLAAVLVSTRGMLCLVAGLVTCTGFLAIGIYAATTDGPHGRFFAVGMLVAFAASLVGYLFGFLFGIPRVVSSGELRQVAAPAAATAAAGGPATGGPAAGGLGAGGFGTGGSGVGGPASGAASSAASGAMPRFAPSSNLAEISDWLTKLLLGAGLVSLTQLGTPLGHLVEGVARGLRDPAPGAAENPAASVVATAVMCCYLALGFLAGYIVTTTWYQRLLDRLTCGDAVVAAGR